MERISVESTNIESIGYDRDFQILEIEFHNGAVYQYFDVLENIYEALMGADSKGKYFSQFIKGNYRYSRV
jgi:hypothetical protein